MEKISANKNNYSVKLAQYGIDNNPNMKDFGEFKIALINALSSTPQGQQVPQFLDENELVELFKQSNVRAIIEQNIGKAKADEMYNIAERTDFVVTRKTPLGTKTGQQDIKVAIVGKPIKSKGYVNRKGKRISSYNRTYNKWTPNQINFLKKQKTLLQKNKTNLHNIAFKYNKDFKKNLRSTSSISSKIYRL